MAQNLDDVLSNQIQDKSVFDSVKINLAQRPQFDWKQENYWPPASGSIPPGVIIFNLTPHYFFRSIYIHASENWRVKFLFMLGGLITFEIKWFSRTFPITPPSGPQSGDFRFSFLDGLHNGKNEFVYSHPSQARTHLQPFYVVGQWNQVRIETIGVQEPPEVVTNQDWVVAIKSQSHW